MANSIDWGKIYCFTEFGNEDFTIAEIIPAESSISKQDFITISPCWLKVDMCMNLFTTSGNESQPTIFLTPGTFKVILTSPLFSSKTGNCIRVTSTAAN